MWLDKLIGVFSPSRGLSRTKDRQAMKLIERKYDSGAVGRRLDGWRTSNTGPNAAKSPYLNRSRSRSRDLIRNNGWAKKARKVVVTNVVGKGIIANLKNDNEQSKAQIQKVWDGWANNKNLVDYNAKKDFNSLTRLVMGAVFDSGEVLVRRRRTRDGLGFSLQVLESDHLVTDRDVTIQTTGNRVVQGVELDDTDKVVAYHLYKNHPGNMSTETKDFGTALDIVRVPASDILHIYDQERPGEVRGVPWLSCVTIPLRDLDEFEDAMMVRQKIASMYAGFITESDEDLEGFGSSDEKKIDKMEPGMMQYLRPGQDVKFGIPPLPQAEAYKFFVSGALHKIAAGIGITYESLTGELSEVNFSSARMGRMDMERNIDTWRLDMIIPMFLEGVYAWFLEAAAILREPVNGTTATWVPPKREVIDPTKEIPAQIRAVRGGLASLSDTVRQSGKDPREHFKEIAKDNEMLDELGLVFDTDPRNVTAAGMFQIENEPVENGSDDED